MTEVIKVEDCGNNIGDYDIPIYNAIIIPKGATNGDMIKAMFPNETFVEDTNPLLGHPMIHNRKSFEVGLDWWNTPYKKEVEE